MPFRPPNPDTCPHCGRLVVVWVNGSRQVLDCVCGMPGPCPKCQGKGQLWDHMDDVEFYTPCDRCLGTGKPAQSKRGPTLGQQP
jgi:DnaJ-class molecular chaperone